MSKTKVSPKSAPARSHPMQPPGTILPPGNVRFVKQEESVDDRTRRVVREELDRTFLSGGAIAGLTSVLPGHLDQRDVQTSAVLRQPTPGGPVRPTPDGSVRPASEIERELGYLAAACDRLDQSVADLRARLAPVLTPVANPSEALPPQEPVGTEVGKRIHERRIHLMRLWEILEETTGAVGL